MWKRWEDVLRGECDIIFWERRRKRMMCGVKELIMSVEVSLEVKLIMSVEAYCERVEETGRGCGEEKEKGRVGRWEHEGFLKEGSEKGVSGRTE